MDEHWPKPRSVTLERGITPLPFSSSLPLRVVRAFNRDRCAKCKSPCQPDSPLPLACLLIARSKLKQAHREYAWDLHYQINRMLVEFCDETGMIERPALGKSSQGRATEQTGRSTWPKD